MNSCASVFVYACTCMHAQNTHMYYKITTLVLQSDTKLIWPSFLQSATVTDDIAEQ